MPSKKELIYDTILKRVRRGTYTGKIPGERALATEFGMDFKTVNRAIGELVDQGTLVRRRGLGTFVAPVDQRSDLTLALCCYKYTDPGRDPVFTRFFAGVNRAAKVHRLRLDVTNLLEVSSEGSSQKHADQRFEDACLANDPDGLIYLGNMNLTLIERLHAGRPTMVIGALPAGTTFDHIRRDIAGGTGDAVRQLAAAGHTRIAFATYVATSNDYDMVAKETGYRTAIEDLGLESLVITLDRKPSTLPRLIADHSPPPTAVVCSESTLGLALTRADPALGQIPWGELAITSFDDGDIGALTRPPMSSIHAFGEELGELAVERLVERLSGARLDRIDDVLPCPTIERIPHLS